MEIKGAELFAAGTWNRLQFSEDDVAGIARSFDALNLGGRVPLKLGHEGPDAREDPTTQFAMGWVKRVWQEGKRLMGDLEVPDQVHTLIKQGFLKFVSIELLKNVQAGTRVIPWVLDAVALLGTDQPAVGILKDLQTLTMARRADLQFSECVTFRRDQYSSPIGDKAVMPEQNDDKSLADKVVELSQKIASLTQSVEEGRQAASDRDSFKRRLDTVLAEREAEKVTNHRAAIKNLLEDAVKAERILPSVRERFCKFYSVESDAVMKITAEDVKEYIKENPNPNARKERRVQFNSIERSTDDAPPGTLPDEELHMKAVAFARENGAKTVGWQELVQGAMAVARRDKDLGEKYRTLPDDFAAGRVQA